MIGAAKEQIWKIWKRPVLWIPADDMQEGLVALPNAASHPPTSQPRTDTSAHPGGRKYFNFKLSLTSVCVCVIHVCVINDGTVLEPPLRTKCVPKILYIFFLISS